MGFVRIKASIGRLDKTVWREIDFLADSGSWYMVLPTQIVEEMQLQSIATRRVILADGRQVEVPMVPVYVRVFGRETVTLAAVAQAPEPLFGTSNMEDLGITLDPSTGQAQPTRPAGLMLWANSSSYL